MWKCVNNDITNINNITLIHYVVILLFVKCECVIKNSINIIIKYNISLIWDILDYPIDGLIMIILLITINHLIHPNPIIRFTDNVCKIKYY